MTELYIGGSAGGTVAFSQLSTPVHEPTQFNFYPYSVANETGGGTVSVSGSAYFEMYWESLTRPERDQLRTFCPGPSETAYFYVPTNESGKTFDLFQGMMIWPQREKYKRGNASDILRDFTITVKKLVAV